MPVSILRNACFVLLLSACSSSSRNSEQTIGNEDNEYSAVSTQPTIALDEKPQSLMDLPKTQYGGFVLAQGYYEAEFKTYCLQPGTPDPSRGDAYLQGALTGYRKDIIESVLVNSREKPKLDQRNIQLLLWSVVSGSNFDKLSYPVRSDAMQLLTPKQVFKLKGGVGGVLKTVSNSSQLFNANSGMQRLFESGITSYETFERLAVLKEPAQVRRKDIKYDQWYKQKENYYVRYFPLSYKKVRIQVYVPANLLDAEGKVNGEYVVFDPTGQQAIPAFTNSQRLGIGAPVLDIVRIIIQVNNRTNLPKKLPPKKNPKTAS
ncbi:MAG: hypothetical protein ABI691_06210 [Ginsengibacter sp.]